MCLILSDGNLDWIGRTFETNPDAEKALTGRAKGWICTQIESGCIVLQIKPSYISNPKDQIFSNFWSLNRLIISLFPILHSICLLKILAGAESWYWERWGLAPSWEEFGLQSRPIYTLADKSEEIESNSILNHLFNPVHLGILKWKSWIKLN